MLGLKEIKEDYKMRAMTAKEVEQLLNEGKKLNIIDVREVDEVAAGKIPGAVNIRFRIIGVSYA